MVRMLVQHLPASFSSMSVTDIETYGWFMEVWHICACGCRSFVWSRSISSCVHSSSYSLFLQTLLILSERGGWNVDLTFAGNPCCNSRWVLRWCGLFASEKYTMQLLRLISTFGCLQKTSGIGTQTCGLYTLTHNVFNGQPIKFVDIDLFRLTMVRMLVSSCVFSIILG